MRFSILLYLFYTFCFLFLSFCRTADNFAQQGLKSLDNKNEIQALVYFNEALERDSDNPLALYGKGRIFIKNYYGKEKGKRMLQRAVLQLKLKKEYHSYFEDANIILAQHMDSPKEAISTLETALDENIITKKLCLELNSYYQQVKNWRKALLLLVDVALKNHPHDTDIQIEIARIRIILRRYKQARKELINQSEIQPNRDKKQNYYFPLAVLSYLNKDRKAAMKYIKTLFDLTTDEAKKNQLIGIIRDIRKRKWKVNKNLVL